jgi:hypothetical protein
VQIANAAGPIDWNGDGAATNPNVPFDINGDGTQTDLQPCNDWQILKLRGGAIGSGGYAPPVQSVIPHELTPADQVMIKPPDNTPPVTTASIWPAPNGSGWNRTPVDVTLTSTDDISGVARIEYDLDGLGPVTYSAPVTIADEGIHQLGYRSIDHSQNVEGRRQTDVRIDLTAPEVIISYDPVADDLVVEGRDSLSGVATSPVAPIGRTDVEWTSFGSDVAELRTYQVRDRADNSTTLYLKVRCSPFAYEASVLAIVYDDAAHHDRDASAEREEAVKLARGQNPTGRARAPRNTMVFERLVGRNPAAPLLGVRQIVAIGERDARRTVRARWDALDDYTILVREAGAGSCGPCRDDQHGHDGEHGGRGDDAQRREKQSSRERMEGACSDNHNQETGSGREDDKRRKRCGPTVVSETDIRGMVVLHVLSEDGRLYVME